VVDNLIFPEELAKARAGARKAHATTPGIIEFDDLVGEAYLWVSLHKDDVVAWRDEGAKGLNKVSLSCYRYCVDQIRKERARTVGDAEQDQYYYSIPVVRSILPSIWDGDDWTSFSAGDGEIRSKGLANEGGDRLALIVDVRGAFYDLSVIDQATLVALYYYNHTVAHSAAVLNMDEGAVSRAEARAVNRIITRLGGTHPSKMY
jgi:DNA-directed RNA polymerase specialized sigma24 family protein